MLPLEEYEQILEEAWHKKVFHERSNDEVISITLEELKASLGKTSEIFTPLDSFEAASSLIKFSENQ